MLTLILVLVIPVLMSMGVRLVRGTFRRNLVPNVIVIVCLVVGGVVSGGGEGPLSSVTGLLGVIAESVVRGSERGSGTIVSVAVIGTTSRYTGFITSAVVAGGISGGHSRVRCGTERLIGDICCSTCSGLGVCHNSRSCLDRCVGRR